MTTIQELLAKHVSAVAMHELMSKDHAAAHHRLSKAAREISRLEAELERARAIERCVSDETDRFCKLANEAKAKASKIANQIFDMVGSK